MNWNPVETMVVDLLEVVDRLFFAHNQGQDSATLVAQAKELADAIRDPNLIPEPVTTPVGQEPVGPTPEPVVTPMAS